MQKPFSSKLARTSILEKLQEKRSAKTNSSSRDNEKVSRGVEDSMLEFVRETSQNELEIFKFNDMTDHDIDVTPGDLWEELQVFNTEYFDDRLVLTQNAEKKFFKLSCDDEMSPLEVKIKFFALKEEDSCAAPRYRVRFTKKRGDLSKWYSMFNDMKDTVFEDLLLAPLMHHAEELTAGSDDGVTA